MRLLPMLTALCASCVIGPIADKAPAQDDTGSRACRSLGESWFRLHVGESTP